MLKQRASARKYVLLLLPFFLFFLAEPITYAQTNQSIVLTLKDAIFLALRNNPTLKSQELDRVLQKYSLLVAKNNFEPKYTLGATWDYNRTIENGKLSHSQTYDAAPGVSLKTGYGTQFGLSAGNGFTRHGEYTPSLTFTVIQPLIKGFGKTVVEDGLKSAYENEEINKLTMKDDVAATINTVLNNYMRVLIDMETLKVDQLSYKNFLKTLKNDEARYEAGRISRNDLTQDKAKLVNQQSILENDQITLNNDKLTLLNSLGLDSQTPVIIPENFDYAGLVKLLTDGNKLPSSVQAKKMAIDNDLGYQSNTILLRQLGRALLVAKDNKRWQLDLTLSNGRTSGAPSDEWTGVFAGQNQTQTAGLKLTIPIDDMSAEAAVLSARIALETARINYAQERRQIENDMDNLLNTLKNNKQAISLSVQAFELQKQSVEAATIRANAGNISNFELLDQQSTLTSYEQTLVNNIESYVLSLLDFNRKIGVTLDRFAITIKD